MGNITTTVLPFGNEPPVNFPSSEGTVWAVPEETVWAMPLLFTQQTFCPAVIAGGLAGLNVNEPVALMVTLAPELAQLAGLEPPPYDVELLHAATTTSPTVANTSVDRM